MSDRNDNDDALNNAGEIIDRFGGIRPMAKKMNVAVTTVQGWKKRDVIPGSRRNEVLSAAQTHNVDLSDLLGGATIANENNFDAAVIKAQKQETPERRAQHENAVRVAKAREEKEKQKKLAEKHGLEGIMSGDLLMEEIKRAEKNAIGTSAWVSALFILMTIFVAVLLLWPSKQKIDENGAAISDLTSEVKTVAKDHKSFLKGLIPDDVKAQIDQIKGQAIVLQETLQTAKEQAESMSSGVMGADAGPLSARIGHLEDQMRTMEAPTDLTAMMSKLETLSRTVEGQSQLMGSFEELQNIVTGMQGQMGALDSALESVQTAGDSDLGQTLEGLSGTDLKAAALLLGLSQFRTSLNRSEPFDDDLALLQNLLGEDHPELQSALIELAPHAQDGVLSPERLSDEFKGLAGDIVVSSLTGENISIQEKAKARLNELLQVEKNGELITGTDTQASVARAQKMLDDGNIEGALAELQTLEGSAAETAAPFMNEAAMTLMASDVESLLSELVSMRTGIGGNVPYIAKGHDLKSLINRVEQAVPGGSVVSDESGSVNILQKKKGFQPPKLAPAIPSSMD